MTHKATTSHRTTTPSSAASRQPQGAYRMDDLEFSGDFDGDLVLPPEDHGGKGNIEARVQSTQDRLSQLRAEAEALEREKVQFEELSLKQRQFMDGRAEMVDKLHRSVTMLDRETFEAQKKAEQMSALRANFSQHLDVVAALAPEKWNATDLPLELGRALSMIEDAREEHAKGMHRLSGWNAGGSAGALAAAGSTRGGLQISGEMNRANFMRWAFMGSAFSLPLIAAGVILWLLSLATR